MRHDVLVVGGGTAGCVLAARLSESPTRSVCLLEAGPDYGAFSEGRWPSDLLDARTVVPSHLWEPGAADGRTLGGRVLGGSSSVNACMVVQGTSGDYDEWGPGWSSATIAPFLERARTAFRTAPENTADPGPFHLGFMDAAVAHGFARLDDMDDPERPLGVGSYPANVVDGVRWNAAFAYLDGCRDRPNLAIGADTLVDRVVFDGGRATGVLDDRGGLHEAETIVLAAGAYFSPAILLRSGVGLADELEALGISVVADLPVGRRLADHCGATMAWTLSETLRAETERRARAGTLFAPHALLKAASSSCTPGGWDLHLVSWLDPGDESSLAEGGIMVFDMKPTSRGRVTLRSRDPADPPIVDRGFLTDDEDLSVIVEGLELARAIGGTEPLGDLLGEELRPGTQPLDGFARSSVRGYFHPAGTCPIGEVVDRAGRVLGIDGLVVADASVMPTVPRANTNLTTAAIAERIAAGFEG